MCSQWQAFLSLGFCCLQKLKGTLLRSLSGNCKYWFAPCFGEAGTLKENKKASSRLKILVEKFCEDMGITWFEALKINIAMVGSKQKLASCARLDTRDLSLLTSESTPETRWRRAQAVSIQHWHRYLARTSSILAERWTLNNSLNTVSLTITNSS